MSCMARTVSFTARPLSSASRVPLTAISRVCRLLRAFWSMMAFICSRLAVISWTEVACSLVPCDRPCEAEATWAEAATSAPGGRTHVPMMRVNSAMNSLRCCAKLPGLVELPSMGGTREGCLGLPRGQPANRRRPPPWPRRSRPGAVHRFGRGPARQPEASIRPVAASTQASSTATSARPGTSAAPMAPPVRNAARATSPSCFDHRELTIRSYLPSDPGPERPRDGLRRAKLAFDRPRIRPASAAGSAPTGATRARRAPAPLAHRRTAWIPPPLNLAEQAAQRLDHRLPLAVQVVDHQPGPCCFRRARSPPAPPPPHRSPDRSNTLRREQVLSRKGHRFAPQLEMPSAPPATARPAAPHTRARRAAG